MSISLRKVSKRFGDVAAVDHVDLDVADGELVALLGPSGGGKTTLLRMIAGLENPSAGDIMVRGLRVNKIPVQKRNIGFVFQGYALFRHMTVAQNIAFVLTVKGWPKARKEARVRELLGLLALGGLDHRRPHELSGGQRQRVAIARALAPKPSVLLLDEPFGAVDAKIRQELRDWLATLHHELRLTTLFVTHDQEEAMEVSNRIVIVSRGRVEQTGAPRQIYEEPVNEFVARFIGVLNVLEGDIHQGMARVGELQFPAPGRDDGEKVRIGFRPFSVRLSPDLSQYSARAVLRQTYFLGVMLRVELELPSGLRIRSRMTKEEYSQLGFKDGQTVSFHITNYRILAGEHDPLTPEMASPRG